MKMNDANHNDSYITTITYIIRSQCIKSINLRRATIPRTMTNSIADHSQNLASWGWRWFFFDSYLLFFFVPSLISSNPYTTTIPISSHLNLPNLGILFIQLISEPNIVSLCNYAFSFSQSSITCKNKITCFISNFQHPTIKQPPLCSCTMIFGFFKAFQAKSM